MRVWFSGLLWSDKQCGYGLVVECGLPKAETGVRFSLPAQPRPMLMPLFEAIFLMLKRRMHPRVELCMFS